MFSESSGMKEFKFFLHNIFQETLSVSLAQNPGAALGEDNRAISPRYSAFLEDGLWEVDDLKQIMFPCPLHSVPLLSTCISAAVSSPSLSLSVSIFLLIYYEWLPNKAYLASCSITFPDQRQYSQCLINIVGQGPIRTEASYKQKSHTQRWTKSISVSLVLDITREIVHPIPVNSGSFQVRVQNFPLTFFPAKPWDYSTQNLSPLL